MQAIEVTVFLAFAMISAALITSFLFTVDFQKFQENLTKILTGESNQDDGLKKVTFTDFLSEIYQCWQTCIAQDPLTTPAVDCRAVYLESLQDPTDPSPLSTAYIQSQIIAVNYCEDCNVAVSNPNGITMPSVVNISCNTSPAQIIIS